MNFKSHTDDSVCSGCEDRLRLGHPEIVRFYHYYKELHPDLHCSWVYRDEFMQNEAYESGASKLRFPMSKHNLTPSQAIDLFQINENGKAVFDPALGTNIDKDSKLSGFMMRWGGEFRSLGDYLHFELA